MAYASRSGRAHTNSSNPQAFGVCQRCGIWTQRRSMQNQVEWRGAALLPTYIFVCPSCWDVPQEQLRAIVVPADPVPITLAFPEPFIADEVSLMTETPVTVDPTTGLPIPNATMMTTVDGVSMTPLPYGRPIGLGIDAVMPMGVDNVAYGEAIPVLSLTGNGTPVVTATCSAPHGLATNAQIAVAGVSSPEAEGFFSITVTSATAFTYQTYSDVPSGSLLTGTTRVVTALVGLPYTYAQIQQVGP